MLIIDNSALSFAFNVLNGVPILPFYDNQNDEELDHLVFYLNGLKDSLVNDIRVPNEEAFGLTKLVPDGHDIIVPIIEGGVNHKKSTSSSHDDIENKHHTISREYLRCDPVEIQEESESKTSQNDTGSKNYEQSNLFVDQPINLLSLMKQRS